VRAGPDLAGVSAGVRDRVAARLDDVISLAVQLVELESPTGDVEGSRAVVDGLVAAARDVPAVTSVERIASPGYGEHVRMHLFGATPESVGTTLVVGHTDTVHPRGSVGARPVRREGERLFGPGVFDMKANCVLALEVARAMAALGVASASPVVLLLTCDEEAGSPTGRALVEEEARRAASALVLEPSAPGGRVKTSRKGVGVWTVSAHGRAAHAGLDPDAGASAVLELAHQVVRLQDAARRARGTTVNVGTIRGGTGANVVAERAEAHVEARFTSMDEADRVDRFLRALAPVDRRVRLSVAGGVNRPPLERTPGVARLYARARDIAAGLGFELGEQAVGGASDGNFAAGVGAAVLDGLGIQGDGAHAAHEHIVTTDIPRRGALLAGLIASLRPEERP
jgi:glutamate carboxypeptidase